MLGFEPFGRYYNVSWGQPLLVFSCDSLIETTLQAKTAAPYARFGATY